VAYLIDSVYHEQGPRAIHTQPMIGFNMQ